MAHASSSKSPENSTDAHDVATVYDKHWEVAQHARALGLNAVAAQTLLAGDEAIKDYVGASRNLSAGSNAERRTRTGARTFEEAEQIPRKLGDKLITSILEDTLEVGGVPLFSVKSYLDNVPMDDSDRELLNDPEQIAALYSRETDMIQRTLRISVSQANRDQAIMVRNQITRNVREQAQVTPDLIRAWVESGKAPGISKGLRWGLPDQTTLVQYNIARPNLSMQDHVFGVGMMAYSDKRVVEKRRGQDSSDITKRIYLNPKIADAPDVFSDLLGAFNEEGLSVQIKMWGREGDLLAEARRNNEGTGAMRGDGLVVYAKEAEANAALTTALEVAKQHADAFIGRKLSRVPQPIAQGIGVGEEPNGAAGSSLTSHRADFLDHVTDLTKRSGLQGQAAIDLFRKTLQEEAPRWHISPHNIAFNKNLEPF